jgi:hypothetical protein
VGTACSLAGWYLGWTIIGVGMSMGTYDAGPVITGITLVGGFASMPGDLPK